MLPGDFDFSVLDDPSFKEDAVREEIIAPILRALGYRPSGEIRVERGKSLKHPYVVLGTTQRKLNLIPDYILYKGTRALAVIDAKAPNQRIVGSKHVQQVYSYAIHPEIRCAHFGLCNGRELIVFEVATLEPLLHISTDQINAKWPEVDKALHHSFLDKPFLREFRPDFGIGAKVAAIDLTTTSLIGFHVDMLARLDDATYAVTCGIVFGDLVFAATFDMPAALLKSLLECLPQTLRDTVEAALGRSPFHVVTKGKIKIDLAAKYGEPTTVEHETFVPLIVTSLLGATYLPDFKYEEDVHDVPPYVFQL